MSQPSASLNGQCVSEQSVLLKLVSASVRMVCCISLILAGALQSSLVNAQESAGSAPRSIQSTSMDAASKREAQTRFVATWGNDANSGTIKQPWRTIQHAADSAEPGETVFVRGGIYRELVTVTRSGSADAGPVTFDSFPGETPVLDGSKITPPADTWSALFYLLDQSYITIRGFELRNYTATLPGQEPAGILVVGKGSHIEILENRIHNIQVVREGTATCDPDSCNGHGIAIYGLDGNASLNHITIAGNEVYNLKTGWSETVTVDGNVEDWSIDDNTIHHNDNIGIDAAGFYGFSPNPKTDLARNGRIAGNQVFMIDTTGNPAYLNADGTYSRFAAGIYVDGGSDVVIEQNDSHENDLGVEVASENTGHNSDRVIVRNNLIYRSVNLGLAIGGYDPSVGGTSNTQIVNNTFYSNDTLHAGFGELFLQSNITKCEFKNNLLYADSQALFISNYVPFNKGDAPVAVDYNLYYSLAGETNSNWMWNNIYYTGFENYRKGSHQDTHSKFADPLLIKRSASPPNLDIKEGSPARGAGIDLGPDVVGRFDYAGNPRLDGEKVDMGAYEYRSNPPIPR